jgi:hypothetical protein
MLPRADSADIALLLEGTFPYVSGGVSSWVNQIIRAFPEYRFALVFLGSRRSDYGDMRYRLPDNVVHLETHYLHEQWGGAREDVRGMAGDAAAFGRAARLHDSFRAPPGTVPDLSMFRAVAGDLLPGAR